jgi:hypothetical protein
MAYYLLIRIRRSVLNLTGGILDMAKVTVKFLTAYIGDNQVEIFLKKMEKTLKDFSGDAYHFRYEVEGASSKGLSKKPEKRT